MARTKLFGLPAEGEHGFSKGFTRDGAGIQADATDHPTFFDDGDALAQFRRLHRGPLTRGAASDTEKIKMGHVIHGFGCSLVMGTMDVFLLRVVYHNLERFRSQ